MKQKRRQFKMLFAGGSGGGGEWIYGTVAAVDCDAGTLSVTPTDVDPPSLCTDGYNTIEAIDPRGHMSGLTDEQMEASGVTVDIKKLWSCEDEEWNWHLMAIYGPAECEV